MMRNRIFPALIISSLVLGCSVPTLRAQQASGNPQAQPSADKPQTTIRQPGNEVQLAVTVRDKKGALVPNLTKSDLELTQDGRPQTIQTLTRESNLPFKVGLLVDTSRSMSPALDEERKAVTEFVDSMLPEQPKATNPDEVFLLHFDREVELLEDFTPSREKLHREIGSMSATRPGRDEEQGPETTGDERDHSLSRGRNNTQLYDAIFLAADQLMKGQAGRKALILFSDGLDRGSKDTLNDAIDAADRANVEVYTIFTKGQEDREDMGFPGQRRRGGIGYPGGGGGYPGGGGGYPGGGGGRRGEPKPAVDGKKIMAQIAQRTGGHAFEAKHSSDLDPIYKLIAQELRGQYVLTYTPDKPDKEGGFHKIALKANKGDLEVITREGYYAPGGDESK